jgi:hypothetical protein
MEAKRSVIKVLIPACLLLGALILPSAAPAKVHSLTGTVGSDQTATVSMRVVVKNGKPVKLKAFSWAGLDGFCDTTPAGEQSGSLLGSAKVLFGGNFRKAVTSGTYSVNIFGKLKQKGKKVAGTIEVFFNNGLCKAPPLGQRNFVATK